MVTYTSSTTVNAPSDGEYDIKCWGAGAGGQGPQGGGGGGFSRKTLVVTSGQTLTLTVGSGGAYGNSGGDTSVKIGATTHCLAKGGNGSTGGATAYAVGDTKRAGGNGGFGALYDADPDPEVLDITQRAYGGGGGAAGTNQAGGNGDNGTVTPSSATHGAGGDGGNIGGGDGGNGGTSGSIPGGGGGGNTGSGARGQIELTFTASAPPTITTSSTQSINENQVLAIALTANESVTWSIVGGADQAEFEISGSTLRWVSDGTKDFETPEDADTNNVYVVTVEAEDADTETTQKTINVTVLNVAEGGGGTARTRVVII